MVTEHAGASAQTPPRGWRRAGWLAPPDTSRDPAGYLQRTYAPEVAKPVVDAYQMAAQGLGGRVEGIAGSYAKGCPKVGKWPVKSAREAMTLSEIPANMSEVVRSMLSPEVQQVYELRMQLGADGFPSDLDLISTETDVDKLSALQEDIFQRTGVDVEFVPTR